MQERPTITSLLQRVQPLPWEDLSSLLARRAYALGYRNSTGVFHPQTPSSPHPSLLLHLSEEELSQMTVHPFSQHFRSFFATSSKISRAMKSKNTSLASSEMPRQVAEWSCLPMRTTQICASCLQEALPYDRLYWRFRFFLSCPKHRCLLQWKCQQCNHPIPTGRLHPRSCPLCHTPYTNATLHLLTDASFLLQGDLLAFQMLEITPPTGQNTLPFSKNDPRTQLPSDQYFALFQALSSHLRQLDKDYLYGLLPNYLSGHLTRGPDTVRERLVPLHIATIHWMFAQWPQRLLTLLETSKEDSRHQGLNEWGRPAFLTLPKNFASQAPQAAKLLSTVESAQRALHQAKRVPPVSRSFTTEKTSTSRAKRKLPRIYQGQYHGYPLPLRVQPQPWESLASFLVRSAKRMQYEHLTNILRPERSDYALPLVSLPQLTEQSDYRFLSDLLLLSEEQIYHMTLHRFATSFQPSSIFAILNTSSLKQDRPPEPPLPPDQTPIQQLLLPAWAKRHFFLPSTTTTICSLCLQEGIAYDRLYWKARGMLTCIKHAVLLLRYCPTCKKRIPSTRLVLTCCPFCLHPYPTPDSIPSEAAFLLSGDFLTLQALELHHLPVHPSLPLSLLQHDPRMALPPASYFALMRALSFSLRALPLSYTKTFLSPDLYHFLHHHLSIPSPLPDQVSPAWTALTHWIFLHWPHQFFAFLDVLESLTSKTKKPHVFRGFPSRFLLGEQAQEAYAFLTPAYNAYRETSKKHAWRPLISHPLPPTGERAEQAPTDTFPKDPLCQVPKTHQEKRGEEKR